MKVGEAHKMRLIARYKRVNSTGTTGDRAGELPPVPTATVVSWRSANGVEVG